MLADAIRCTSSTGGTGPLTLSAVSGYPQPTDWLGTSGTRLVAYEVAEYTDSTHATLSKYERGIGSLALATNVLTRSVVGATWNGTVYSTSAPVALSFGATAANIRVLLSASAVTQAPALPAVQAAVGDTYALANSRQILDGNAGAFTFAANTRYWLPIEYRFARPITTIALEATSVATTGSVRVGLYDWDTNGLAGNLIAEFTAAAQIGINTATGYKSVAPAAPIWVPPGWYWLCLHADAAVQVRTGRHYADCGAGSSNARACVSLSKSATYGALPSAGDQSGLTFNSLSGSSQPVLFVK